MGGELAEADRGLHFASGDARAWLASRRRQSGRGGGAPGGSRAQDSSPRHCGVFNGEAGLSRPTDAIFTL